MSKSVPSIQRQGRAVVVPLARPVKRPLAQSMSGRWSCIDVETDQGVTGHAYIFAYSKLDAEAGRLPADR